MREILFSYILLSFCFNARSSNINVNELNQSKAITQFSSIYIFSFPNDSISIDNNSNKHKQILKSLDQIDATHHTIAFEIENPSDIQQLLYVSIKYADYIDGFQVYNNKLISHEKGGTLRPNKESSIVFNGNMLEFILLPKHIYTIYINLENYIPYKYPKEINLFNQNYINTHLSNTMYVSKLTESFFLIFAGATLFALFFVLFLYYYVRQDIFLFYALYLLSVFLFNLSGIKSTPILNNIIPLQSSLHHAIHEPSLFFFCSIYGFFLLKILEINPKTQPKIYYFIYYSSFAILVYTVFLIVWIYWFKYPYRDIIYNSSRIIVNLISLIIPILIFKVNSPYKKIILIGTTLFVVSGLITFVLDDILHLKYTVFGYHLNYLVVLKLGILIEALFFAMALGKRVYLLEQERIKNYKNYINELTIKNELEQKVNQINIEVLKSQFQPHFVFNCLNSINYLILNNELDKAALYINKFSKLFRSILDATGNSTNNLEQELATNRLYLELEQERLSHSFQIYYEIDQTVPLYKITLPSLLLQPIFENAIWHGLQGSKQHYKFIKIIISQTSNSYLITIYDNGLSEKQQKVVAQQHKGYGMNITKQKIVIFNNTHSKKINMEYEFCPLHYNNVGTLVIISISK